MDRFNIPLVAEGLTTYAIERQNGFQRQQPPDGPPWAEQRRIWTDSILQSMARLEGKAPDLALMERYDQELSEAKGRFFIIPAAAGYAAEYHPLSAGISLRTGRCRRGPETPGRGGSATSGGYGLPSALGLYG